MLGVGKSGLFSCLCGLFERKGMAKRSLLGRQFSQILPHLAPTVLVEERRIGRNHVIFLCLMQWSIIIMPEISEVISQD